MTPSGIARARDLPAVSILMFLLVLGTGCASSGISREEAMLREQSPVVAEADAVGDPQEPGAAPEREGYTCPVCRF